MAKNHEPGIPKGKNPDDDVTPPSYGAQDAFMGTRYILPAKGAAPIVSLDDAQGDGTKGR